MEDRNKKKHIKNTYIRIPHMTVTKDKEAKEKK